MKRERGRPAAVEPDEFEYDITVVDGPAGRRLAAVQARAVLVDRRHQTAHIKLLALHHRTGGDDA